MQDRIENFNSHIKEIKIKKCSFTVAIPFKKKKKILV